jgi:hypothetical protein
VADATAPALNFPDHTEETIRSTAQLRAEHHEKATPLERALDHMTALLSRLVHRGNHAHRNGLDWVRSRCH